MILIVKPSNPQMYLDYAAAFLSILGFPPAYYFIGSRFEKFHEKAVFCFAYMGIVTVLWFVAHLIGYAFK
jgi:hypothetical protein